MLRKVWFREFRALREVTVALEPLTVIVGANGSGKTSVLVGIELLTRLAREFSSSVLGSAWTAERNQVAAPERETVWGGALTLGGQACELEVKARPPAEHGDDAYRGLGAVASIEARIGEDVARADAPPGGTHLGNLGPRYRELAEAFPRAKVLRFDSQRLAAPSYEAGERPSLSTHGDGLASVLADLASRDPDLLDAIVESTRRVVANLRRVRLPRAKVERSEVEVIEIAGQQTSYTRTRDYWGHRVALDMVNGKEIPLANAGEGTALALGLMTWLHTSGSSGLLLIDDLDRGLHPKAQQDLVRELRAIMSARPDVQIIATTHSPFVLNELTYEEVRLTTLDREGATLVGALTEHPDYARWKDHVQPGELWTSGLEDWLRSRQREAAA